MGIGSFIDSDEEIRHLQHLEGRDRWLNINVDDHLKKQGRELLIAGSLDSGGSLLALAIHISRTNKYGWILTNLTIYQCSQMMIIATGQPNNYSR